MSENIYIGRKKFNPTKQSDAVVLYSLPETEKPSSSVGTNGDLCFVGEEFYIKADSIWKPISSGESVNIQKKKTISEDSKDSYVRIPVTIKQGEVVIDNTAWFYLKIADFITFTGMNSDNYSDAGNIDIFNHLAININNNNEFLLNDYGNELQFKYIRSDNNQYAIYINGGDLNSNIISCELDDTTGEFKYTVESQSGVSVRAIDDTTEEYDIEWRLNSNAIDEYIIVSGSVDDNTDYVVTENYLFQVILSLVNRIEKLEEALKVRNIKIIG